MRTGYRNDQGAITADTFKRNIIENGETLLVTPPTALLNAGVPAKFEKAICEAPNAGDVGRVKMLGILNINTAVAFIFTFPGDSDIVENSTVPWQNFTYKIISAYRQPWRGHYLGIRCFAIRENPLPSNVNQSQGGFSVVAGQLPYYEDDGDGDGGDDG